MILGLSSPPVSTSFCVSTTTSKYNFGNLRGTVTRNQYNGCRTAASVFQKQKVPSAAAASLPFFARQKAMLFCTAATHKISRVYDRPQPHHPLKYSPPTPCKTGRNTQRRRRRRRRTPKPRKPRKRSTRHPGSPRPLSGGAKRTPKPRKLPK